MQTTEFDLAITIALKLEQGTVHVTVKYGFQLPHSLCHLTQNYRNQY